MTTFAEKIIGFYKNLEPPAGIPDDIEILFPQQNNEVLKIIESFFQKFYNDNNPRKLILGINPGRFGAGTTGINFTAPRQLSSFCGIGHSFKKDQTELSAEFIYDMISAYGGAEKFYRNFFISAVSPLGFTRSGKNMNYYDDKELLKTISPFIIENIQKQISFGFNTGACFCIGGDKNLKYFENLNNEQRFFDKVIPLPHPRFIMQYRRKQKQKYIDEYLRAFRIN